MNHIDQIHMETVVRKMASPTYPWTLDHLQTVHMHKSCEQKHKCINMNTTILILLLIIIMTINNDYYYCLLLIISYTFPKQHKQQKAQN